MVKLYFTFLDLTLSYARKKVNCFLFYNVMEHLVCLFNINFSALHASVYTLKSSGFMYSSKNTVFTYYLMQTFLQFHDHSVISISTL